MVDSGVTHKFITKVEARWLNLRWEKDTKKDEGREFGCLAYYRAGKTNADKLG